MIHGHISLFCRRDMCFYGRAVDGLDEDGCVLIMCREATDGEYGAPHPVVEVCHSCPILPPLLSGGASHPVVEVCHKGSKS